MAGRKGEHFREEREGVLKLIYCSECHDVVRLLKEERTCTCGKSWGTYIDEIMAEIGGSAIPLGFSNSSFFRAIKRRSLFLPGERFEAFVIEEDCPTVREVK